MSRRDERPEENGDLNDRAAATAVVWIAYGILMGMIIYTNVDAGVPYAAMVSVVAFFTTLAIWDVNVSEFFDSPKDAIKQKNKRGDQSADAMLMLMDLLSDEEKQDIRRRLMNSADGELPVGFDENENAHQNDQQ